MHMPAHMQNVLDERKISHVNGVILYAITCTENAFLRFKNNVFYSPFLFHQDFSSFYFVAIFLPFCSIAIFPLFYLITIFLLYI